MKLHDANCRVGAFMVVVDGGKDMPPSIAFPDLPDYEAAETRAKVLAATKPNKNIFIVQVTGQVRAVPRVFEIHPNEAPRVLLPSK